MTTTPPNDPDSGVPDTLVAYEQFVARIDAHAARVETAWEADIACVRGCSGCCHRALTVFPIEAAHIRKHLAGRRLPAAERPPLSDAVLAVLELEEPTPCAMLDAEGECRIYEARPLICRSHGLPLAVRDHDGVYGDVCPLSFGGEGALAAVPSEDFLALETINTVLVALNQRFLAATDGDPARVSLTSLAAGD